MSLSRKAKRGIAIFNHIQWKTKREKYMYHRKKMMLDLNKPETVVVTPGMLDAGTDAIRIMRENANVQKLSDGQNHPEPENPEVGAGQDIPVQPDSGAGSPEGTDAGAA